MYMYIHIYIYIYIYTYRVPCSFLKPTSAHARGIRTQARVTRLRLSTYACHPCVGAMPILTVSFQF